MKRLNLRSLGTKTLGLIYPENLYCMACGDTIEASTRVHGLCDECIKKTDWNIENPYADVMEDFAFDRLWTCCRYGYLPRRIMNGFKEKGRTYYAKNIGLLLTERCLQGFEEEKLEAEDFDMVLPVPMTREKESVRGYNQAELLAKEVCRELSIPCRRDVLIKAVETPSMRFSDGRTRRTVLAGAFSVNDHDAASGSVPEQKPLLGKRILLVDDVSTTGSTFDACARTLKEAGAENVTCLCFATVGIVQGTEGI